VSGGSLNRVNGEEVWTARLKGFDFVNVVLDGNRLLASYCGEIYCLNLLTGNVLWHNPLKGHGTGLATIATEQHPGKDNAAVMSGKRRRNEAASASAATVAMMA
jgi:outer membrane protein assembly factor BamB